MGLMGWTRQAIRLAKAALCALHRRYKSTVKDNGGALGTKP